MYSPTYTSSTANASRKEVVEWFNAFKLKSKSYEVKLTSIVDLTDGTAVCLFFALHFPALLNESRIKFHAIYEHDRLFNWKLIQEVLDKLQVKKLVKVDRILSGNCRTEILEFSQWLILFYEQNHGQSLRSPEKAAVQQPKEDKQALIIKSLIQERDLYYSKLRDIEEELHYIEAAKGLDRLFGLSTGQFCQRLRDILSRSD